MKTTLAFFLSTLFLFVIRGIMAEDHPHIPSSKEWVKINDEMSGIEVEFPYTPLEMTFDYPFKNTPPEGKLRVYSTPTNKGLLVLSIFHSNSIDSTQLEKDEFLNFFDTVLAPHFFFDPSSFQNTQTFKFSLTLFKENEAAAFEFSFQQADHMKKLKGIALVSDHHLYISFCLFSEKDFDEALLNHFIESLQIPLIQD